jgi:hypothetical protein
MRKEYHVIFLSDPTAILGETGRKLFDLWSKVPFFKQRLQPNLQRMHRENHVILLSDPSAILGEMLTKNCFYRKSKVPFITERLQPKMHCL